jgi:hypothetical protein
MEINHRITINATAAPELFAEFDILGIYNKKIQLPGKGGTLVSYEIKESDLHWRNVSELIQKNRVLDIVDTFFDDDEIKKAEWSRLVSTFERGYPQPKLHWPLKQMTYKDVCPKCGTRVQSQSLRIQHEPSLGQNSFMSLIWCGEILCIQNVLEAFARIKATGYQPWPVLIHKSGQPSEKVSQIYISDIALPGLIVDENYNRVKCSECGVTKYVSHMRGLMALKRSSLSSLSKETDFILTYEWFGSGLIAYREILVSNRVARLILNKGWKGARLKPVEMI